MMLSKACDYAIRAALYIALLDQQNFVPIREIADSLNISFHFLTKILQTLSQNHIMISYRGPNGGISLSRPPDQITLMNIIEAVDSPKLFEECILGLPGCGEAKPCPIHDQWQIVRENLRTIFEETSLAELAAKVKRFGLRLSESE